jgi:NAD(P) transhydrogenase subunit alpha
VPHVTVGVCGETASGEHRVALVPASVGPAGAFGALIAVEAGAGAAAGFSDAAYAGAGAAVMSRAQVIDRADLLIAVRSPGRGAGDRLRRGQAVLGMLRPLRNPLAMRHLADQGITAISPDLTPSPPVPLRVPGSRPMDAAASQDRIAGYEAAVIAAGHCGTCLSPTVGGGRALVVGAGTVGLQAMATLRGLGAAVEGCDTDPRRAGEAVSTGAEFRDLSTARSPAAVRRALTGMLPRFDLVIVTGREPTPTEPDVLVTAEATTAMRAGSVIVDTTVEPGAGAVELAEPDATISVPPGVTVIGAGNFPSRLAHTASTAYARHVTALLARLIRAGSLAIDLSDPVQDAVVVTHEGTVRVDAVRRQILDITAVAGLP